MEMANTITEDVAETNPAISNDSALSNINHTLITILTNYVILNKNSKCIRTTTTNT